jgi:hypothetical protein
MPFILMKRDGLASRGQNIRKLLQPISRQKDGPAWEIKASSSGLVIATHDGAQPTSEYRDWRFSTFVRNFNGMYFERWMRNEEDEESWYLERAYLSIYQHIDWNEEKEFLCLHCDPNILLESEGLADKYDKTSNRTNFLLSKKEINFKNKTKRPSNKTDKPNNEKYKKGPHLHIKAAEAPLPHAHFALNLGHLDAVLESVESLSEAMRYGIIMLKEEVLDRCSQE